MLHLTLLSFVAGLANFPVALAHHAYCSWAYVPGSPADSGFTRHCLAPKIYIDSTHAQYKCLERQVVADWGYLRPYTLEFATPCGDSGYALRVHHKHHHCDHDVWALCNATAQANDPQGYRCYYMKSHDDCEWPLTFENQDDLPAAVDVWHL
ncbi:hypothetical protein BDZ90DRAFT_267064 [Jaminaea rosea]|uniref:Uncharacterized protein n=1 Tax=Jaminaea rosea TaxID=1569628 RepID=A0A316UMN8_9BASI|nr:hypothetical protein BDZ90DRAFT_267064 [Jaminaea rosea]PWN26526.1 hypothetical protein BDZ90DRAFT_267064 [Jaminaea rosea]